MEEIVEEQEKKEKKEVKRKLTDENVKEIRNLYNQNLNTISELAKKYDVTPTYVGGLIANKYRIDKDYKRTNFSRRTKNKLTNEDVAKIRRLYNRSNVSASQLAKDFNVGILYLRDILANKRRINKKYVRTRHEKLRVVKYGPKLPRKKAGNITPELAKQIRELYNYYHSSYRYLSETYSLSVSALRKLIMNETHKDENYQQTRFS